MSTPKVTIAIVGTPTPLGRTIEFVLEGANYSSILFASNGDANLTPPSNTDGVILDPQGQYKRIDAILENYRLQDRPTLVLLDPSEGDNAPDFSDSKQFSCLQKPFHTKDLVRAVEQLTQGGKKRARGGLRKSLSCGVYALLVALMVTAGITWVLSTGL